MSQLQDLTRGIDRDFGPVPGQWETLPAQGMVLQQMVFGPSKFLLLFLLARSNI
jgi:hypothetical protein